MTGCRKSGEQVNEFEDDERIEVVVYFFFIIITTIISKCGFHLSIYGVGRGEAIFDAAAAILHNRLTVLA